MNSRVLALDVETTSEPIMHPWQQQAALVTVGIADETGRTKTWVFNHNHFISPQTQREMIDEIQREINQATMLVGHNLKFDLNWMRFLGIDFNHVNLWCTQVTEYLLRGQHFGHLRLSDLSDQYLKIPKGDKVKIFWDAGWTTQDIPLEILLPYNEQDCINTLAIYQRQVERVRQERMHALVGVQCELTRVLSDIEFNGIGWDQVEAGRQAKILADELENIDGHLRVLFDEKFNFNSGYELSVALYGGKLKRESTEWVTRTLKHETKYFERACLEEVTYPGAGFKPPKGSKLKKEGYYSTDKNYIDQLRPRGKKQQDIKDLLQKRTNTKKALETIAGRDSNQKKGLINKVQADGRIHGKYNQTIAVTGRLTSSNPNLQNQPRKKTSSLKLCFISKLGRLVSVDLAQIEWRVCAHLCQDKMMLWEVRHGVDAHRENAINILGADPNSKDFDEKRTVAKIITFRLIYGGTAYGFFMDAKMPSYSLKRWEEIVDGFYAKYPGLKKWQDEQIEKVYQNGGVLYNPTGRKFVFDKVQKFNRLTGETQWVFDEKQIKNWPVQSLATADLMPLAMIIIHKAYRQRGYKSKLVGQVHDNLIWDCYLEEEEPIARLCIYVFEHLPEYIDQVFGMKLTVPIGGDVEMGDRWATLEKVKLA